MNFCWVNIDIMILILCKAYVSYKIVGHGWDRRDCKDTVHSGRASDGRAEENGYVGRMTTTLCEQKGASIAFLPHPLFPSTNTGLCKFLNAWFACSTPKGDMQTSTFHTIWGPYAMEVHSFKKIKNSDCCNEHNPDSLFAKWSELPTYKTGTMLNCY